MPLTLPPLDDATLTQSPLVVVVCQVTYEQSPVVSDGDTGIKIHEQLGGREGPYRWIEPFQMMAAQVEISPYGLNQGMMTPGFRSNGWRLRSEDSTCTVSIMPENTSIETTAYREWKGDFQDSIRALLDAVAEHVDPSIEQRLGLRFVNRIADKKRNKAEDWLDVVAPELISPLGHKLWSPAINGSQQQLDLDVGEGARCTMRHGFVHDQAGSIEGYILDYDVFRQTPQRFDIEALVSGLKHFHKVALALFQSSLTPSYLAGLR